MLKKTVTISVIALVILSAGCAALFRGNIRNLPVNSDPDGAEVFINGQFMGRTPTTLRLQNNRSYTVEFRKEGYKNQVYTVNNQIGVGWVVLDILAGFVPIVIDAATGAWYELDPEYVSVQLQSK